MANRSSAFVEISILLAALNKETGEAKQMIRQIGHRERMKLANAVNDIDEWIEDVEQDERDTALGTGKEVKNG